MSPNFQNSITYSFLKLFLRFVNSYLKRISRVRVTRGCLTSATSCLAVHTRVLSDGESCEVLGACRMDADCAVKISFRCTKLHS